MAIKNKLDPERKVNLSHGLTGNVYLLSTERKELERVLEQIGKSLTSIRWSGKYNCYVVRMKAKKHKEAVRKVLKPTGG